MRYHDNQELEIIFRKYITNSIQLITQKYS